jgi:5-methylcytosine-specific restriction protein A
LKTRQLEKDMKKYMCREAGCGLLLDKPGYCDKHRHAKAEGHTRPFENAKRSNYYGSYRWRSLTAKVIRETPYCEICGAAKRDGVILEVHHREPPRGDEGKFYDENNLQVLCRSCHRVITAQEIHWRNTRRSTGRGR